jgi:hypothetical protein
MTTLFIVQEEFADDKMLMAVDLSIAVAPELPPPDDRPSPDKQALFNAINSATTTVRTVSRHLRERAQKWYIKRVGTSLVSRAERLQDEYIRKLAGVARLGLEGPHTELANLALDGLKREFVAAEAGRIKNSYVRSLGIAAGLATLAFVTVYSLVDFGWINSSFWSVHKPFLIAGMGASVGTWLSFSVRRVSLGFEELAVLEEDLLDPSLRVLFVVILAGAACLLFWTGAINIEIGLLKTARFAGATAFLIGVFAGLSERALATALGGRAASFVRSISG